MYFAGQKDVPGTTAINAAATNPAAVFFISFVMK
jgi:hypothetical protein